MCGYVRTGISNGDIAEKGDVKCHRNTNIVNYILAVDASTCKPVTYQVNNGGMVDSKAFQKIITVLKGAGISVEGVILDRGFCIFHEKHRDCPIKQKDTSVSENQSLNPDVPKGAKTNPSN